MNSICSIARLMGLLLTVSASMVANAQENARTTVSTQFAAENGAPSATIELEEIVVTGSRLPVVDQPPSLTVFDRARIEELGVTAIADVLNYLPQQPYIDGDTHRPGGAQFLELRGIGVVHQSC